MEESKHRTATALVRPKFIHYLEFIGFSSVSLTLRSMPLPMASSVSAFFWRLVAPKLKRHKRAMANLQAAMPELSPKEQMQILARMWDNLGRTSAETLQLHEIADDAQSISLNFSEDALSTIRLETPAIFVSLHSGNWEITAIAAEKFNKPLIGIYKKVLNPLVDAAIIRLRARFYRGGLVSRGPDTVRQITRAIKSGQSVAIMGDLRDSHGDFVPFFGIPSRSTTFPALLARLHHLPIIVIRAVRTAPGQFRIDADRLELAETSDRKADIIENTTRLQAALERWIREDPALWMWGHRRWNADSFKRMKIQ